MSNRRYLVFSGENYYPLGGWADLKGTIEHMSNLQTILPPPDEYSSGNWYHVVDMDTLEVVAAGRSEGSPAKWKELDYYVDSDFNKVELKDISKLK